ncbi:hypothetical protein F5141DRAFT_1219968 [Pisolithus sp. B1]|nr:hypothetical protein F5141DRAFT_1219968 [Pisolithus sp. B1]
MKAFQVPSAAWHVFSFSRRTLEDIVFRDRLLDCGLEIALVHILSPACIYYNSGPVKHAFANHPNHLSNSLRVPSGGDEGKDIEIGIGVKPMARLTSLSSLINLGGDAQVLIRCSRLSYPTLFAGHRVSNRLKQPKTVYSVQYLGFGESEDSSDRFSHEAGLQEGSTEGSEEGCTIVLLSPRRHSQFSLSILWLEVPMASTVDKQFMFILICDQVLPHLQFLDQSGTNYKNRSYTHSPYPAM